MEPLRPPQTEVETIWRTILVTDARDSSKAYFSARAVEALVRIERDRAVFAQIAAQHGGEEARDRGDGSMFAFCDPLEALRAAMAMQAEVTAYNASLSEDELQLCHRMGLHIGQIKLVKTRLPGEETVRRKLSGDIVVTASRLEGICHPGEVCLSNDVYRLVAGVVDHDFLHLDATLKGFDRPMRCWSTRLDPSWGRPLTAEEEVARDRKAEEKRLRARWEQEQEQKYRRFVAVRGAAWFAAASLMIAGLSFFKSATDFDVRLSKMWAALLTPVEGSGTENSRAVYGTMRTASLSRPRPLVRAPRFATRVVRRPANGEAKDLVRKALDEGALIALPATMNSLGFAGPKYDKLFDDADRVRAAQEWLSDQLGPAALDETQAVVLERPVAGMTVLTGADGRSIQGLDGVGRSKKVLYSQLTPRDFAAILSAANNTSDPIPAAPSLYSQSLESLRREIQ